MHCRSVLVFKVRGFARSGYRHWARTRVPLCLRLLLSAPNDYTLAVCWLLQMAWSESGQQE